MVKTKHKFFIGNAEQELLKIRNNSIQLIVTSPPYWNARDYVQLQQIGFNDTYENYLTRMRQILNECVRVLLPDGKIALNIGNIYTFNNTDGRVFTVNLILDLWKILNDFETLKYMGTFYWKKTTSRERKVLFGSYPYPSNFMISTALETVHVFRKIGERVIPKEIKENSRITKEEFRNFREPIWYLNGISKKEHSAVFPNELPQRLIKMYSFFNDWVLDPFCGIGTTNIEALKIGRNSIGIDIREDYIKIAKSKLKKIKKSGSVPVFNLEKDGF
jgi:DNA modification methylase